MRVMILLCAAVVVRAQVADKFVPAEPEGARLFGPLGAAMRTGLQGALQADEEALLAPFEKRPAADPRAGEALGRYLYTAAELYRYQKDQKLKVKLERVLKRLLAAQETDGYLGTEVTAGRWKQWDVVVHKELLTGLLSYARVFGDERALAAAKRAGELLTSTFGPSKRDILASSAQQGWAGTALLAVVCDLHRVTGDARLLAFAGSLVSALDQPKGPELIHTLLTGGGKAWPEPVAGDILENLIGLLEYYRLTGDERLLLAAVYAQEEMAGEKRYAASPWWLELNWHLLRLTAQPVYARVVAEQVRAGLNHPRLVAMAPQFLAGSYATGVAIVAPAEGTVSVAAAGKAVRLEMTASQLKWIEGDGRYPLWFLARAGRPLYVQRPWTIGGVFDLPQ